jgi:DNA-binding CsgD family transcriptional regulator
MTLREIEVMKLVSKNITYREVAEELFISITCVSNHVQSVMNKLTAYNKQHAIERFAEVYSKELEQELLKKEYENYRKKGKCFCYEYE